MSDLFDSLREPGGLTPLPPEEIRRRGDRLRRRRTTLQVVGTAAAVAIVAGGVGLVTTRGGDGAPAPAPRPTTTETPQPPTPADVEGVITTDQLRAANQGVIGWMPEDPGPRTLDCQAAELSTLGGLKVTTRAWTGRMDDGDLNHATLAVLEFDGSGAARTAYETVASWVEKCDQQLPGAPALTNGGSSSGSEASETYSSLYTSPTGSGDQQGVGQASSRLVLLSMTRAVLGGSADDVRARWDAAMEVALIVASGQTPELGEGGAEEIPEDIGLTVGWPSDDTAETADMGIAGPSRVLPRIEFRRCDETFAEPSYVDRLRADWTNPEDYRHRALTTFEDAEQAVAYVDALGEFYRGCPVSEVDTAGNKSHYEVRPTAYSAQSFTMIQHSTYDGEPTVGVQAMQVVRVGRAVLVDVEANEGGVSSVDDALDAQAQDFAPIIAAMCLFTVAGC